MEFTGGDCVLHREGCFTYNRHREELAWERREELGEREEPRKALELARLKYPACSPCYCCFHSAASPPMPRSPASSRR